MTFSPDDDLAVLVVDDRADKLLALRTVLEDICPRVVIADSGREALKFLLEQDFAVILLDVNMPGMDGFETAELIRQRKNSEHTPIIFITSFGDDMLVARGYSLGAVDYILAPIVPEVLRTKVSVFLELYRKTREVERQAMRLQERAEQLHKLTQASLAIHSAASPEEMLRLMTGTARDVFSGDRATTLAVWEERDARARRIVSDAADSHSGIGQNVTEWEPAWRELVQSSRPDATESGSLPVWRDLGTILAEGPGKRWLMAPLGDRDGRWLGVVHVRRPREKGFNEDDEALLLQLARMASIAVENALNADAREANRIKDEFLATLSHELRTPLTAMLGWTQLLCTGALNKEETERGLEIIERNVLAQARLIDDLLDVSRIIAGKLRLNVRHVSLVSVVEAALDVVRPTADAKQIRLTADLESGTGQVLGDADRLQQVVWNLLMNAVRFTPAGGEVRVRLRREGHQAQIEVSDTGEGIAPAFLHRIFDRFRQADSSTKRTHGGLGLGLAIVRHVVELHGGSVRAHSDGPGQGATFWVHLPIVAVAGDELPHEPIGNAEPSANEASDLFGLRVLVVDDEADGRQTIAAVLEHRGAVVETAASAPEAFECIRSGPPDVLVSDIAMPGEDGYDLIKRIRAMGSEAGRVPAVALTAFAREEDAQRALAAGFQRHASKPIRPAKLVALVAELAGRGHGPAVRAQDQGNGSAQASWLGRSRK